MVTLNEPINGHPWLTRADVIAAQCAPYSRESAAHARTLAWEALTVRATAVATDLLAYARAADPSYPRLRFRPAQVQPSGVVTDTGREHGPAHPIDVMERMAYRTPNTRKGSLGDLRQTEAGQIAEDYQRALDGDERLVDEYELDWLDDPARALGWIKGACMRDAMRAIARWTTDPQAA